MFLSSPLISFLAKLKKIKSNQQILPKTNNLTLQKNFSQIILSQQTHTSKTKKKPSTSKQQNWRLELLHVTRATPKVQVLALSMTLCNLSMEKKLKRFMRVIFKYCATDFLIYPKQKPASPDSPPPIHTLAYSFAHFIKKEYASISYHTPLSLSLSLSLNISSMACVSPCLSRMLLQIKQNCTPQNAYSSFKL